MPADTLQSLGRFLSGALENNLDFDGDQVAPLLNALGWEAPPGVTSLGLSGLNPLPLFQLLGKLNVEASAGSDDSALSLQLHGELFTELQGFLTRLASFGSNLNTTLAGAGDYLPRTQIASKFHKRFLDLAIIQFAEKDLPAVHAALVVGGIFRIEFRRKDPGIRQVDYLHHEIDFGRLGLLLTDPAQVFQQIVGWGTPNLKIPQLTVLVGYLLQFFGVPDVLQKLPRRVEERLFGRAVPEADGEPLPRLPIYLLKGVGWDPLEVGVTVFGLRPTIPGGADGGIGFAPFVRGTSKVSFPLRDRWTLEIDGLATLAQGVALLVRPNGASELKGGILSGGELQLLGDRIAFKGVMAAPDELPFRLIAIPGGSRLEIGGVGLVVGARPEFFVEVELRRVHFILSLEEGGGLLRAVIPKDLLRAELDLAIGWAEGRAYLRGSADLQTTFPVGLSFGPVDLQSITVGLAPNTGKLPIEVSATLESTLGPLTLLVERIGLTAAFDFPGGASGNLGPLNVGLGFKVPTGIGLALDAGPVTGGGYLALDPTGQRYGGILQLKLSIANVVAFGIYEQVQGQASFVAVLGIRFNPGVQLSFGFALTGVGGLVGLNRRANIDVLRDRLASSAAGNVLFCEDPVKNAPTILGDLAAFFPAALNGFLVGPTLQISWLSPIVRLDIGILIEFPGPSKIVILGSIRAMLGLNETLALLYLRMDVLGIIDFEQQLISIDAALVNSNALGIVRLTGGMAFRLSYGNNPYILLSVGGFHPRFDPGPLNIPRLARIGASLDISVVVNIYIRVELYVAFTSNTLQLGAHVEARMDIGPLGVHGYFAFDALIQFRPFYFDLEFSAGFDVEVFGTSFCSVSIVGRISGPGPIVIYARGSVKRLFVRVSASATFELGENNGDTLTPIASPVHELAPELRELSNLRTEGEDPAIVRRPGRPVVQGVLVSPKGSLIWEQKRAPLKTIIDRLGGVPLTGQHELHLDMPAGWTTSDEQDWFNPGSFTNLDLKASQSLNNATFQELTSGLKIGSAADAHAEAVVDYLDEIDLVKRPAKTRFEELVAGAYLTNNLHAMLVERTTTPPVEPGPPKVVVKAETADVHAVDGTLLQQELAPFQAFQFSRQNVGRIAVPTTDVTVDL
jgi:hypothetical protein